MRSKKFNQYVAMLLSLILVASLWLPTQTVQAEENMKVNASAAILIDGETGQILFEQNPDQLLGIASMTKMMTEYLLLEAINEKKVTWDQQYTVSEYAYKISQDRSLSNVPLRLGETYNVRELYEAMTIYSANGAAIAIAEVVAGSETEFVKLMNKKAKELGLKDYKFVNASGLSNSDLKGMHPKSGTPEDENVLSARATAKLAFELLEDYPEVLETASIPKKSFREGTTDEIKMSNWNWMLPSLLFGYEGMTGLKTGTTDFAGSCFTGTAERDGRQLISVVMNAKDESGKSSPEARFVETKKLLDYGFDQFEQKEIFKKGYQVKGQEAVDVPKGKSKQVAVQTETPLVLNVKKGENTKYKPYIEYKSSVLNEENQLEAPVKKGEVVGFLSAIPEKGEPVKYLTAEEEKQANSPVVVKETVEKANWFVLSMRAIGSFFSGAWSGLVDMVTGWF
ncbi:D-alanyl-D-alanine carboxypeptidase family protein [Bacillus sp. FJAT-52991]|uniref:serine-type D-Ala-D-Ala carboxypeptidase n=1 Tax=Bacillus kandeliae TaxID=3129297 RepID=A0ABZ2N735_9BACI